MMLTREDVVETISMINMSSKSHLKEVQKSALYHKLVPNHQLYFPYNIYLLFAHS